VSEVIAPAVAMVPGAELCLAVREERWRGAEEMLRFYHSIDVYVCASRSEGTPNPCLEAAACGVPVVTTRVGNMPELIRDGENGFFVERHPAQLAEKLTWLLEDRSLRREMGLSARRSSEAWDWRIQATHYGALFASALGNLTEAPVLERADR
jgi:glycosyltransferase involved in cell wall biosynthesis